MYQTSKRLIIFGAFLGLACGFLLTQQPTNAAAQQPAKTATQVVKADSNVVNQGVNGTCHWEEVKEEDGLVLTLHAGKLDNNNIPREDFDIKKIVIDPGVIAPENCNRLFADKGESEIDGINNLDTSHVTNMSEMFFCCPNLKNLDLSNWDTSHVTNMNDMFTSCGNLVSLNLKNWDTSNVTNMGGMFSSCGSLTSLDLSSFKTEKVTSMWGMFQEDPKLKKLDLSSFYTPNLISAEHIFSDVNFESLDIRNFDTSKLQDDPFFEVATIGQLIVGKNFKNVSFPQLYEGNIYNINGSKQVGTSDKWVALNGPEQGSKKNYLEMTNVTRTETVTYVPETKPLLDNYTEYKTVTRTINLHLPNENGILSFSQKANIHRKVTINADNSKTYGEWSKDYWDEYNAPNLISFPKPAKVDKQIVDGDTPDQTVDIYY